MSAKDNPQTVIDTYRKRQRMTPFLVRGFAVLLGVVGIILLVAYFLGGSSGPGLSLFASATPTATSTATPTATVPSPTATSTATETVTPTITLTPTLSGPFEYTVQELDNCFDLATTYNVDLLVLLAINNFPSGTCPIDVGDVILIPIPGQALPTATPIPEGVKLTFEYIVETGDTLAIIASRFNTTIQAIITETNRVIKPTPLLTMDTINTIYIGQRLMIPANIVTPTPTRPVLPSSTSTVTSTP